MNEYSFILKKDFISVKKKPPRENYYHSFIKVRKNLGGYKIYPGRLG